MDSGISFLACCENDGGGGGDDDDELLIDFCKRIILPLHFDCERYFPAVHSLCIALVYRRLSSPLRYGDGRAHVLCKGVLVQCKQKEYLCRGGGPV